MLKVQKIEEINNIYIMLSCISYNMFSMPRMYKRNENGNFILSGESITAVGNTIKSIEFCCSMRYFSDGYALLRKYRDDVMQYLYITSIFTSFKNKLVEKDEWKAIYLWFKNDLNTPEHKELRKKYFNSSKYKSNLQRDPIIKRMFDQYFEKLWKQMDRVFNDYVHSNGMKYILRNYATNLDLKKEREQFLEILKDITSILIAVLAIVDPFQLRSSDYIDALEMKMNPDLESASYVMPGIVEYMKENFPKINPDLINFIHENNQAEFKFMK